jgi:hypothetical protein
MGRPRATYLLIIGDREALAWVLTGEQMAFPPTRASAARQLRIGDRLLIYTTRGCFHNPGRDRGRVIGTAAVESPVEQLDRPVVIAGREFTTGCSLIIESLAPLGRGIELAPLVPDLDVFPEPNSWSAYMRRPLLALTPQDARLIERKLTPHLHAARDVMDEYIAAGRIAV